MVMVILSTLLVQVCLSCSCCDLFYQHHLFLRFVRGVVLSLSEEWFLVCQRSCSQFVRGIVLSLSEEWFLVCQRSGSQFVREVVLSLSEELFLVCQRSGSQFVREVVLSLSEEWFLVCQRSGSQFVRGVVLSLSEEWFLVCQRSGSQFVRGVVLSLSEKWFLVCQRSGSQFVRGVVLSLSEEWFLVCQRSGSQFVRGVVLSLSEEWFLVCQRSQTRTSLQTIKQKGGTAIDLLIEAVIVQGSKISHCNVPGATNQQSVAHQELPQMSFASTRSVTQTAQIQVKDRQGFQVNLRMISHQCHYQTEKLSKPDTILTYIFVRHRHVIGLHRLCLKDKKCQTLGLY